MDNTQDKVPADFRCNEDSGPAADIIKFLDGIGGPEPSAAKKHLRAIRWYDYRQKQISQSGGPDPLGEIRKLERQRKDLDRRTAKCPACGRQGDEPDVQTLREVKLKLFRLRREKADRIAAFDDLRPKRRTAQVKLYQSADRAIAEHIITLGIPQKLEADRDLYVEFPEEIPEEIVATCRQVRELEKLTKRLIGLVKTPAGLWTVFGSMDDEDLEEALRVRLGATVVQRPKPARPDPSAPLDRELGEVVS